MPISTNIYKRLPGLSRDISRYSRLYQGSDHLLQVHSTGYSETYKRFYYRDIQAIIITRTNTGKVWNVVWGALAILCGLPAFDQSGTTPIVFWSISGFFLLCLGLNVLLGPTCICHLSTAIQTEKLPSLKRLRKARKVLGTIQPLIVAAQGEISPEALASGLENRSTGGVGSSLAPAAPSQNIDAPPVIS